MTYDNELTLIGDTSYTTDEIGNQIPNTIDKNILCSVKSIVRDEFYSAAVAGLKPECTFVIHGYEYSEEKYLKFEGNKYKVLRTYAVDFEELELTCERVIVSGS